MRLVNSLALLGLSAFTVLMADAAPAQELVADGDIPGTRIAIQDIKRDEGGTVTLRFQIINDTGKNFGDRCAFREDSNETCGPISGVYLLDAGNKKKYLVVRDSDRKCACSEFKVLEKGDRLNLWAKFAAPPTTVQKVTVVVPQFQPVESVPITNR